MDLSRPFFKLHDRVINVEAISDVHIQAADRIVVRMLAPGATFVLEGQEATILLKLLKDLWVDSHV